MVRIAVTNPCVRCFKPTPAIETEVLNWGDLQYRLPLCQKHHMQLEKEIRAWTNLGQLIDESLPAPVVRPVPDEEQSRPPAYARPPRAERLFIQPVRVVENVEDDELEPWRDELPAGAKALANEIPELADWRLTRKAREEAGRAGIEVLAVMMTAAMPEDTRAKDDEDPDIQLHMRGPIRALVNVASKTVITAYRYEGRPVRDYALARSS